MFSYSFLLVLAPLLAAQMGNSCQCQSTTYSFNGQCYCDQSAVMVISCIQRMKPTAFMMTLPTNNSSTTIEYNPTAKDESNKRLRKRQDPQAGQQPQNPFQQQPTGQQMGPSSGMSPFQQQPGGQAGTSPFQQPFPGQQQGPQTSGISPFQQQPGQPMMPGQQPGMGMPQPGQPQPGQPQPGQPQSGQSGGQPGQSNSVEQQCIQQTGAKPSGSSGTPNKPSSATSSNQLPKIVLTMGVLTFIL